MKPIVEEEKKDHPFVLFFSPFLFICVQIRSYMHNVRMWHEYFCLSITSACLTNIYSLNS